MPFGFFFSLNIVVCVIALCQINMAQNMMFWVKNSETKSVWKNYVNCYVLNLVAVVAQGIEHYDRFLVLITVSYMNIYTIRKWFVYVVNFFVICFGQNLLNFFSLHKNIKWLASKIIYSRRSLYNAISWVM